MTERPRWTPTARRVGIAGATAVLAIGVLYVAVITLWLVLEGTPGEPIGDPYLAVMEALTMVSALALVGLVVAIWCFADAARRVHALIALVVGSLAAGLTLSVHFVQLTAVRQMWRAGALADYRLIWPSPIFAVEYLAWDVLIGLTMVTAGIALSGAPAAVRARRALVIGGGLCLVGVLGPFTGRMAIQNVAVVGYAIVLPVAGALTARLFRVTPSEDAGA